MRGLSYLLKEGVRNVWNNRMMSLASIGVLVSCLIITGAAVLLSMNVTSVVESVGRENQITVFLNDDVKELEAVMEIGPKIRELDNISDCEFYSKDEAMNELRDELGSLFTELQGDDNPLPHAFHVQDLQHLLLQLLHGKFLRSRASDVYYVFGGGDRGERQRNDGCRKGECCLHVV